MRNILCTKVVDIIKEIINCHLKKNQYIKHFYNIVCESSKIKNAIDFIQLFICYSLSKMKLFLH